MQDSIFTKIVRGEIPAYRLYEDATTLAFLDIKPLLPGHTLVVPKLQVDQVDELPSDDYRALFETVQKVAQHLRTTLGTKRSIIQVLGFDVPHAHVHIIPANSSMEYFEAVGRHVESVKTGEPYPYQPTQDELMTLAKRLHVD
ncbi:MAG TPA: HIT domain-containing protein [Verrucomicrobiae bacterium]|nr:HIT domain-containing protein [Verrucomicrobiae bacterium]